LKIIIIGNGISGITSARWIRKLSDHQITVISSETEYFFSRTALMYIYMGHMRKVDTEPYEPYFWKKNRIDLIEDHVTNIDFQGKTVALQSGSTQSYDKLIIATGSQSNKFGWPGQDLDGVGGLYSMQDLDNMEAYSPDLKRAVIVGGGLIGIEMAEMYRSRDIPVTMLVREDSYWSNILPKEESQMVSRHILDHHIDLRLTYNLGEIVDDGNGKACAVIVKETGERIECGYVGLTAGVYPNVSFLKDTELNIEKGVVINNYLETNVKDVYAIGDCAQLSDPQPGRRPIEAIWYTGRMMGEVAARNICGQGIVYDPGIWFNSAKFLDIEYQVYGDVRATPAENHDWIYWEHSDGTKSIRIIYDREDKTILGFNLMGVRYRHEVCEKWLGDKTHIEEVLENLSLANFDPEFYAEYESEVISLYNKKHNTSISKKKKRKLDQVIQFLKRSK